ncbi:hypothetical protein IQ270_17560 [Microcoleus sp. LEGE 07076]|nr:hypothetical protein [Microcoleus sp. LEGE 07076]MBE9186441.1 hypothetical protein [Microcoleus sp. LEGE 07076]
MNTLEASIEILKIVTSAPSLKGLDIESKTDKILESFQKIYERIDSIVNQDKRDDSWDDTLPGTFDITLKGNMAVEVIDPTLKGSMAVEVIDPTLKGSMAVEVIDPTLKSGMNIDIMGLDPTIRGSQK